MYFLYIKLYNYILLFAYLILLSIKYHHIKLKMQNNTLNKNAESSPTSDNVNIPI